MGAFRMTQLTQTEAMLLFESLQQRAEMFESGTERILQLSRGFFEIAEGRSSVDEVIQTREDWLAVIRSLPRLRSVHGLPEESTNTLAEKLPDHESSKRYYGANWDSIRNEVLHRDQARCQECGITEPEHRLQFSTGLHIHHREPFRQFDERSDAHDLDNLLTLCASCHRKIEPQ